MRALLSILTSGPFLALMYVLLILEVIRTIASCFMWAKMGIAPWKVFIPFYGKFMLYQKCWDILPFLLRLGLWAGSLVPTDWVLAIMVYMVGWFIDQVCTIKMAECFDAPPLVAIGLVILPAVFIPIIAFGPYEFTEREF